MPPVLTNITTRPVEEIHALKAHIAGLIERHYPSTDQRVGVTYATLCGMSEALQWVLGQDTKGIEIVRSLK